MKQSIDQNQREYFLREQMRVIQEELGDKDGVGLEIKGYRGASEKSWSSGSC